METLNAQIRELRKVSGLSQALFAEKFEIPTSTLQDWEHNRRTPPIYVVGMIDKILSNEKYKKQVSGNSILNKAKSAKDNDEFYTTYETVEKEVSHYVKEFKGKTVLCNCDDPFESSFSKFFIKNFNYLGLKGLICTSYCASRVLGTNSNLVDMRGEPLSNDNGYVMVLTKVSADINPNSSDEAVHDFLKSQNSVRKLVGDGDFRSDECVEYLKLSDIVVTNPPFSLFRELIALATEYEKQFLVIGNQNAITYKEIFPLIQENKAWIGYQFGDMSFRVPQDSEPRKTRFWIDENGQKWRSLGNAMWLTNIDMNRRHERLILTEHFDESIYPKYDSYDAVEVSKVANIPMDYDGIMGVPITFLNKYNPEQFEIVGEANHGSDNSFDLFKPTINGKLKFKRILIRNKVSTGAENNG
ncbi:adenine-specific methyltransferase EcoRI family protein [Lachnospiraceae bacterium C1.1]|nr:adenine-specific methyltransferase EcoRI family protein [Lachnospiraceae bacterium C1.1]